MKRVLILTLILLFISPSVYAMPYEYECVIPDYKMHENIDHMQVVLEASLEGVPGEYNGWGYKEEYGYYIVAQHLITTPNTPGYGFLTLWIEVDDVGTLHPIEEHITNGSIVYPVNEPYTNDKGETFIPFYFTEVNAPNLGLPHTEGVYWLYTKYLDYYPNE